MEMNAESVVASIQACHVSLFSYLVDIFLHVRHCTSTRSGKRYDTPGLSAVPQTATY